MGAPDFKPEHLPVFACSMGDNTIHYMGHVTMMGAVQPFISGAISKCVVGDTLLTTADGSRAHRDLHHGEAPDSFRDEVHRGRVARRRRRRRTRSTTAVFGRSVRWCCARVTGWSALRTTGSSWRATGNSTGWRLEDVRPTSTVAVQYGDRTVVATSGALRRLRRVEPPLRPTRSSDRSRTEMTEELAFLLGAYAVGGAHDALHVDRQHHQLRRRRAARVAAAWESEFGVDGEDRDGLPSGVRTCSSHRRRSSSSSSTWGAGPGHRRSGSPTRSCVRRGEMVLAFLQGLALDAYATVASAPEVGDLRRLAGHARRSPSRAHQSRNRAQPRLEVLNTEYGKTYDEVYATGEHAQRLVELRAVPRARQGGSARELNCPRLRARGTTRPTSCPGSHRAISTR